MTIKHILKDRTDAHIHETVDEARACAARYAAGRYAETPASFTGRNARTDADRYEFVLGRIESLVLSLNSDLGLDPTNCTKPRVSFGYIGNCGPRKADGTYANDDRTWMVFLPHPGRVGTDEDRIGSFRTNDLAGAQATVAALMNFRRGLLWGRDA